MKVIHNNYDIKKGPQWSPVLDKKLFDILFEQ